MRIPMDAFWKPVDDKHPKVIQYHELSREEMPQ